MLFCNRSDAFREMIDSVAANKTFDETKEYLKNSKCLRRRLGSSCDNLRAYRNGPSAEIKLDPGFKIFFEWCKAHNVPYVNMQMPAFDFRR